MATRRRRTRKSTTKKAPARRRKAAATPRRRKAAAPSKRASKRCTPRRASLKMNSLHKNAKKRVGSKHCSTKTAPRVLGRRGAKVTNAKRRAKARKNPTTVTPVAARANPPRRRASASKLWPIEKLLGL